MKSLLISKLLFLKNPEQILLHGKNGFANVSKNLAKYRSKNNFNELLK